MDEVSTAISMSALAALPSDRPVSLLMRHAPRVSIHDYSEVYVAGLTPAGQAAAEDFGLRLAQLRTVRRIVSSPVSRCVDTALAISKGAGWRQLVRVDDRISHPFISPVWLSLSSFHYPQAPIPAELATILSFVNPGASGPAVVDVFVTHDTVVGSLAGYFTGQQMNDGDIPNYLEAVFIWQEDLSLKILWRGLTASLNLEYLTG